MADSNPQRGQVGAWGVRGEFESSLPADEDPRYEASAYDPAAYVRIYIGPQPGNDSGWITIYGGIPLDDIDDIVDSYIERYEALAG